MEKKPKQVEFYLGRLGRLLPLLTACIMIIWAACSQSNVNGYVVAFFAAVIIGAVFAKDDQAYGAAIIHGLSKPMFSVIVLAVILAAISGKMISSSGMDKDGEMTRVQGEVYADLIWGTKYRVYLTVNAKDGYFLSKSVF